MSGSGSPELINLARLGGKQYQCSTLNELAVASHGSDTRPTRDLAKGDAFSTAGGETDPWWVADMKHEAYVHYVEVEIREDADGKTLDGWVVRVGHSPRHADNPVCGTHVAGDNQVFCGRTGRFVSIEQPGNDTVLTAAEVRAWGFYHDGNLAATSLVNMSSTDGEGDEHAGYKATDQNLSTAGDDAAQTTTAYGQWISFDLGEGGKQVDVVTVTLSDDDDGSQYWVSVGDDPNPGNNPLCFKLQGISTLCGKHGKYVGLKRYMMHNLSISDIQIYNHRDREEEKEIRRIEYVVDTDQAEFWQVKDFQTIDTKTVTSENGGEQEVRINTPVKFFYDFDFGEQNEKISGVHASRLRVPMLNKVNDVFLSKVYNANIDASKPLKLSLSAFYKKKINFESGETKELQLQSTTSKFFLPAEAMIIYSDGTSEVLQGKLNAELMNDNLDLL